MTTASQTNAAQAPAASGGPGAPKTARGARTRARILKAAEHTFGTLGYHRAGISDITRAAGGVLDNHLRAIGRRAGHQGQCDCTQRRCIRS